MLSNTAVAVRDNELLGEPSLEEMLAEPIIRLIMKRDGVNESAMRGQIELVQRNYGTLGSVQ